MVRLLKRLISHYLWVLAHPVNAMLSRATRSTTVQGRHPHAARATHFDHHANNRSKYTISSIKTYNQGQPALPPTYADGIIQRDPTPISTLSVTSCNLPPIEDGIQGVPKTARSKTSALLPAQLKSVARQNRPSNRQGKRCVAAPQPTWLKPKASIAKRTLDAATTRRRPMSTAEASKKTPCLDQVWLHPNSTPTPTPTPKPNSSAEIIRFHSDHLPTGALATALREVMFHNRDKVAA
jgi:hypothetical protein